MSFLSKLFKTKSNPAGEGNHSPRIAYSDTSDLTWIQPYADPFQLGGSFRDTNPMDNTLVSSAVKIISETLSSLKLEHIRVKENGEEEVVHNSSISRLLQNPNPFSTQQEFLLDLVLDIIKNGNGYAYSSLNGRSEITALYLSECEPFYSAEYEDTYYGILGAIMCRDLLRIHQAEPKKALSLPSRRILHIRTASNGNYLLGESILNALKKPAAIASAIENQNLNYFTKSSRVNGVVTTEMSMTSDQTKELKKRLNESMASARNSPEASIPILTNGLKYQNIDGYSNLDTDLINVYRIQSEQIADALRIPSSLLSISSNDTAGNSDAKMNEWKQTGLLYWTKLIENAFNKLLQLDGSTELIRFDVSKFALGSSKEYMESLATGVSHGILSVNQAKKKLGGINHEEKHGFESRVQMQLQPLKWEAVSKAEENHIDNQMKPVETSPVPPDKVDEKSILWMYSN